MTRFGAWWTVLKPSAAALPQRLPDVLSAKRRASSLYFLSLPRRFWTEQMQVDIINAILSSESSNRKPYN
jgi:hypothetical protein